MKQFHYLLVLCILLGCCIPVVSMSVYFGENINAMNSVKEFTGNSNLEIEQDRCEHTPHAEYIVLFHKNTEYWVNSDSNRVERYSAYEELENCKDVQVSLEGARLLADSFIEAHDKAIDLQDFSLVMNEFVDGGDVTTYYFLWRKYIGEIESPSFIFVSVNPTTGAIIHYISIDRPVTVSLGNNVTQEEAESIALKQFPGIEKVTIDLRLKVGYDQKGSQRLFWECSVSGDPKDYIKQGGYVIIDAMTGEVLEISQWL